MSQFRVKYNHDHTLFIHFLYRIYFNLVFSIVIIPVLALVSNFITVLSEDVFIFIYSTLVQNKTLSLFPLVTKYKKMNNID